MSYIADYQRINWENEPSVLTPLNDTNLNAMDAAVAKHDSALYEMDRNKVGTTEYTTFKDATNTELTRLNTVKAENSTVLLDIKEVAYNATTGVWTFTHQNGTVDTFDQNIEKIPVTFTMSAQGVITMETADGTQYTADVGSLIKTYTFNDSSVIDFTTTTDASGNKNVTASIVLGSITDSMLESHFLASCTDAKNAAQTAATNASNSATAADGSAEDAEAWANGTRNGSPVPSTDPAYNNNAKYWVEHLPIQITQYSQTLTAGSTSVTFNNVTTTANSIVEVATSVAGLEYNAITNSGSSYTVTFDVQNSNVTVYLIVTEVA